MKLTALRLHNVRRFGGHGVAIEDIGDGVNVLSEANEFGKSTCFDALHALFFLAHSGTSGAVQALRPYSGGNPVIEADIATTAGRFRLRKQYYAGRKAQVTDLASGRLVAQADDAEAFIGELVRGGTLGPAGLLWVRQGNTGLDKRPKTDEEEKRARETVLSSVQGEVESITGGRRMRAIAEACAQELGNLVTTTLRPTAGFAYAAAIDLRASLGEKEAALAADVQALHDALDRRRRIRARLAELENPEDLAAQKAAIARTEQQLAEARLHAEKLRTAEAEARLCLSKRDAAREAWTAYNQAMERYAALSDSLVAQTELRDAARDDRAGAQAAYDAAALAIEQAEQAEKEARTHLDRLERAARARAAAEHLTQARETLASAEALRQAIEQAEAARRLSDIPADRIQALEALDIAIAGLRAVEAAKATTLRMTYAPGGAGVLLNDSPLPDGVDVPLDGMARLSLPQIGTLTIRPSSGHADQSDLATREDERRRLLDDLGIDNLAMARQRQEDARQHGTKAEVAREKLAVLAPNGLQALHERIARLETESQGDAEAAGDVDQARLDLDAAGRQVTATRYRISEMRPRRDQAERTLADTEAALAAIVAKRDDLEAVLGEAAGRDAKRQQLSAHAVQTEAERQGADALVLAVQAQSLDLAMAEAAFDRARSVAAAAETEKADLRQTEAELNGGISTQSSRAVEEELQETTEKRRAADAAVARYEREVKLLVKVRDALATARNAAREHYFEPVMGELRPLLNMMFDDATVVFDDETLLPTTLRRNGLDEQIPVLSGGMREQLAMLTRLAFAHLLAKEGRPAPVILDDALVYSDDDRIEKIFDALHRQARSQQIIVFSCRQRAFSKLGGNRLALRPWTPDT